MSLPLPGGETGAFVGGLTAVRGGLPWMNLGTDGAVGSEIEAGGRGATRSMPVERLVVDLGRRRRLGLARRPSPRPPTLAPNVVSDALARLLSVRQRDSRRARITRRRLPRAAAPAPVFIGG